MDKKDFEPYIKVFLNQNSMLNLISKKEEKFIWEKHICDSLSLKKFFEKYIKPTTMLDIGTGGGFPAVPVAIAYPEIEVWAIDSIAKKIRAIEAIKCELDITNLYTICTRVELLKNKKFDLAVSRAVASLDKLIIYADKCVCNGGYFVAFKSKLSDEELKKANCIIKNSNFKYIETIEYKLPTEKKYERRLIVFKKIPVKNAGYLQKS